MPLHFSEGYCVRVTFDLYEPGEKKIGSALFNHVSYSGVRAPGADNSGVILLSVAAFLTLR